MIGIDGSSLRRLTFSPNKEEFSPTVSLDGEHLAFLRRTKRAFELVVKRIDSDQEQVIRQVESRFSRPDFSPNGKGIVYAARNKNNKWTIFTVGIDGRGTHSVVRGIKGAWPLPQWTRAPSR